MIGSGWINPGWLNEPDLLIINKRIEIEIAVSIINKV